MRAKQTENPFSKSATHSTTYAGEYTHTDVWGPARFAATNGARYYMTFIDDYSRHCTIKLLSKKSEAFEMVKGYLAFIERHLGFLPKAIRADNGGEYVNNDLKSWLNQRGILLDPTAPYSPQQNGIAERYNRTLADLIRAMLCAKKLPKILWGVAALHAGYLRNRADTRSLPDMTPMERWSRKRPDVASFQEFGTPVSILHQGVGRDKLDPRGDIHILLVLKTVHLLFAISTLLLNKSKSREIIISCLLRITLRNSRGSIWVRTNRFGSYRSIQ